MLISGEIMKQRYQALGGIPRLRFSYDSGEMNVRIFIRIIQTEIVLWLDRLNNRQVGAVGKQVCEDRLAKLRLAEIVR